MLIVLLIIFIIIFFISLCAEDFIVSLVPGLCILATIFAFIIFTSDLVDCRVIDEKIAMYTEENTFIETQLNELVTEYMEYESETLKNLHTESVITLVSLYPELKSDELVKAQIGVYIDNNSKIRELREKQLNKPVYKWWLYFGK